MSGDGFQSESSKSAVAARGKNCCRGGFNRKGRGGFLRKIKGRVLSAAAETGSLNFAHTLLLTGIVSLGVTSPATAADLIWHGGGANDFVHPNNWAPTLPPSASHAVSFQNDPRLQVVNLSLHDTRFSVFGVKVSGTESFTFSNGTFVLGEFQLQFGLIERGFENTASANIGVSANLEGSGGITQNGSGTMSLSGTNTISGGLAVQMGILANSGSISTSSTVSGGRLNNTGTLAAVNNQTNGTFNNYSSGSATNVTNAGDATNAGNISGNTSNSRTFSNSGTIGGTLANSAGTFTNTGTVTGATTISGGTVNNTSRLGAVEVQANGTFNNNTGGTSASVTNAGTGTNAGTISGDLTNAAGTFSNSGTVNGTPTVSGGTVNNTGTLGAVEIQTNGTFNNNTGGTSASVTNAGTGTNAGTISGDLTNAAGTFSNSGTVNGTPTVSGGTVNNTGTLGAVEVQANGTFNNNTGGTSASVTNAGTGTNAGTITGTLTNTANTFENTGTVNGTTTVSGGTVNNTGTVGAVEVQANGTFTNKVGGTAASLTNAGIGTNAGTIDGTLTNTANTFENTGTVTGTTTVLDGTVFNTGTLGDVVNRATNTFHNQEGGTATNVTNDGNGTNAGTITGTLTNISGNFDNSGTIGGTTSVLDGTVNNTGVMGGLATVEGGSLITTGTLSNGFDNRALTYFEGMVNGNSSNSGDAFLTGDATNNGGVFENSGVLSQTGSNTLSGLSRFDNTGTLQVIDPDAAEMRAMTISAATFTNSGIVDLRSNNVNTRYDDQLIVNGNLNSVAGSQYNLDLNLSSNNSDGARLSDQIVVNGNLTGTGVVNFAVAPGGLTLKSNDIVVFDVAGANSSTLTPTGLPVGEPISYEFIKRDSDWVIESKVKPGAASLAGGLSLAGSVMGSGGTNWSLARSAMGSAASSGSSTGSPTGTGASNRSANSVVYGAGGEEGVCAYGPWVNGTGGVATVGANSDNGENKTYSELDLQYSGLLIGLDSGCVDFGAGLKTAVGLIGGHTAGSLSQGTASGGASATNANFTQTYAGAYVSMAKGSFVVDVQARYDYSKYKFNNITLGLINERSDSHRASILTTASYGIELGGFNFTPNAGFEFSRAFSSKLNFGSIGTLDPEDTNSAIGFAGAVLSRSFANAAGNGAFEPFVSASYTKDFSKDSQATFTDLRSGVSETVSTETLNEYGEISAGLSYKKILGEGFNARQLTATARVDYKFGEQINAVGVTGRLKFEF